MIVLYVIGGLLGCFNGWAFTVACKRVFFG